MTRNELKLATIATIIAWLRKRRFHDDADALTAARQCFDHLPASIIVAAVMIASDHSDAVFWDGMEDIITDAAPMVSDFDTAMLTKGTDLSDIPF